MKILLYYEPTIFAESFNIDSIQLIKNHLWNMCGKSLSTNNEVEIKIIISEAAQFQNNNINILKKENCIVITDLEILKIFDFELTLREIFKKITFDRLSNEEEFKYKQLISNKLNKWVPDIIITFPSHNNYLKKLYPNSLVLNNENGIFSSRAPFMRTLRYEPFGYIDNFTNKYAKEINTFYLTDKQNEKVEIFRKQIIELVDKNNSLKPLLNYLKKQYRKLILVPLITCNFYEEAYSNDEYVYLLNILEKIPKDVGIIITKHDTIDNKINKKVLSHLKQKYNNIIDIDLCKYNAFGAMSLPFYSSVDAVINCMTGTGLLATIWNTRIIANDKLYSHWFADSIGLDNIEEKISAPIRNKNNMLYWYLTHFVVFEKHFNEQDWYYNYFKNKLEKYQKDGITFDFFEQVEDFDDIAKYIIEYVSNYYTSIQNTPTLSIEQEIINKLNAIEQKLNKPTFLQQLFSVRNECNHKVVRILGIKIKFKK